MLVEIIQQSSRLSFIDNQPGELFQTSTMVTELHHARHDSDLAGLGDPLSAKLLDVETQFVQPSDSSRNLVTIVNRHDFFSDDLVPQAVISNAKFITDHHRIEASLVESPGSLKIQHFSADVVASEIKVVLTLPV